jgi:hypothetical protein
MKRFRNRGRGSSFGVLVVALVVMMASTSAPSPIYPLYLQRWGFSVLSVPAVLHATRTHRDTPKTKPSVRLQPAPRPRTGWK